MSQQTLQPDQAIRVMQIITLSMIGGVILFGLIAVLAIGALSDPPSGVIVSAVGAAFAGVAFVLHLVVPGLISGGTRGADESAWYGRYLAKHIIGLAILEGAAFFNIVACIVEHNWWSLAIAGGLVFWMLAAFPTHTKVEHWVETQRLDAV